MDGTVSGIRENGLLKAVCKQNAFSAEKNSKLKSPGSATKKANGDVSPRKRKHLTPTNLCTKYESAGKGKGLKRARDELSDTDSDMPLSELQNCASDDDDNIVLAKIHKAAAKKLKKSHSQTKGLENQGAKSKSMIKPNGTVKTSTATDDEDDVSLAVIKKKKADAKQQSKNLKKSSHNASPKKKVDIFSI